MGRREALREVLREAVFDTGVVGLEATMGVVAREVGREERVAGVTTLLTSTTDLLVGMLLIDEARSSTAGGALRSVSLEVVDSVAEVLREEDCMFWMRLRSWSCISSRLIEGARAGEACARLSSADRDAFLNASLSALNRSTLDGEEGRRVGAGCGEASGDI